MWRVGRIAAAVLFVCFATRVHAVEQRANDQMVPQESSPADSGAIRPNDFSVIFRSATGDMSKFLTFGWNGFAGGIVHWRYNDTNRSPAISATATDAINSIQAGMAQWTAACNVTFVYDGTTTSGPDLAPPARTRDGVRRGIG